MNSGEPRKYVVPLTRMNLEIETESIMLTGQSGKPGIVGVTFTPAPEFIREPLTAAEQAELARLCEATRGDV